MGVWLKQDDKKCHDDLNQREQQHHSGAEQPHAEVLGVNGKTDQRAQQ